MLTCVSVVVFLGLVSGCSGGDDDAADPARSTESTDAASTDAARAADVIASALAAQPRANLSSDGDAPCIAETIVDEVGIDRLEELGLDLADEVAPELTVPPMTAVEGDQVVAAYDGCLDLEARHIESFMANGLSLAEARCASDRWQAADLPRTHLLLRNHDETPHEELHLQVEALWDEVQTSCRESAQSSADP